MPGLKASHVNNAAHAIAIEDNQCNKFVNVHQIPMSKFMAHDGDVQEA